VQTTDIINTLLKTLAVSGMVSSVVLAPNAVQVFGLMLKYVDKRQRNQEARRVLDYMKRRELITWNELPDGQISINLTKRGKNRARKVDFDTMSISKPRSWDGRWRLVMFDIPEDIRKARSALSVKLKLLGFYQLQKSAWAHAYPCEQEIELIKRVFGIPTSCIIYAEILKIDRSYELYRHFKLQT